MPFLNKRAEQAESSGAEALSAEIATLRARLQELADAHQALTEVSQTSPDTHGVFATMKDIESQEKAVVARLAAVEQQLAQH